MVSSTACWLLAWAQRKDKNRSLQAMVLSTLEAPAHDSGEVIGHYQRQKFFSESNIHLKCTMSHQRFCE
ncbi:hypothetical protein HOLleu_17776 [Holothuria leucospilota]|uniref:Uncharacterized protein n=1 Tax=Holothuria leucospilota TaxID=206669 RepID=A0A9Q1C0U1_HOLLE|nr:hypothetical protein HOLleu_17776 [Holothuria leucospilota]